MCKKRIFVRADISYRCVIVKMEWKITELHNKLKNAIEKIFCGCNFI